MKKNKLSIKTIVAIGIGSAVFMILGRFGSLPTGIPNTNIFLDEPLVIHFEKKSTYVLN